LSGFEGRRLSTMNLVRRPQISTEFSAGLKNKAAESGRTIICAYSFLPGGISP